MVISAALYSAVSCLFFSFLAARRKHNAQILRCLDKLMGMSLVITARCYALCGLCCCKMSVPLTPFTFTEKLSLSCSIVYYYNGAQRYEQFLQVGQLYWALILLSWVLFRAPLCLRSSWCYICIKHCFAYNLLYLLVNWAWWDWPLTWLTNHHPSVLLVGSSDP